MKQDTTRMSWPVLAGLAMATAVFAGGYFAGGYFAGKSMALRDNAQQGGLTHAGGPASAALAEIQ